MGRQKKGAMRDEAATPDAAAIGAIGSGKTSGGAVLDQAMLEKGFGAVISCIDPKKAPTARRQSPGGRPMPVLRDCQASMLPASWEDAIYEHDVLSSFDSLLVFFVRAEPDRVEMTPTGEVNLYWTKISVHPLVQFAANIFSVPDYRGNDSISEILKTDSVDDVFLSERFGLAHRLPVREELV